jgi:hypothetical protein
MFYVSVNGQETGGTVFSVTRYSQTFSSINHKSSYTFVFFRKTTINSQFGDLHGGYGTERVF